MQKIRRSLLAVAVGMLLVGSVAGPASADQDVRIGTRVSGPEGSCANKESSNSYVRVCFLADGEWLYVKDAEQDGRSAYGWILVPSGRDICRNPYGAGTWVKCNYSMYEWELVTYKGFTQDNEGIFNPRENYTDAVSEDAG